MRTKHRTGSNESLARRRTGAGAALRSLLCLLVGLGGLACGGAGSVAPPSAGMASRPPTVNDENVHEVERALWRMEPGDPQRLAWRDALVAYRSARTAEVVARGDYEEVVEQLAELAALLTPEDLANGHVPAEVAPLARWVLERGAPRGDEGRVMGALVLLAALGDEPEARRAERERIERWGVEARAQLESPVERFGELIEIAEQQEELAPSPEVLEALARLYAEQREGLAMDFDGEGSVRPVPRRLSMRELEIAPLLVQRAPLDVAAVYLRHGDLERAVEHVRQLRTSHGGMEAQLVRILERAQGNDEAGAGALDEIARGFSRARPEITAAICRTGARRFPTDARFPLCLARVSTEGSRLGEATAWYADAVRLAPAERDVYDEALDRLAALMDEGQLEASLAQSRALARHALEILDERVRRWPDAAPSVRREALLSMFAQAEMSRGNVAEARAHLEASLAAQETEGAHGQLGLLLERTGEPSLAAEHYRRALDLTAPEGIEGTMARADLLERLGDAFRREGRAEQATRMYRQALELWDGVVRSTEESQGPSDPQSGLLQARRGILLSRVGDAPGSERAFRQALEDAPSWRDPYALILSHLVVSAPNVALAHEVLRRAQFQLTLEPAWKVYFALWVRVVAQRAGAPVEPELAALFEDESRGDSWSARLASYARGALTYEALLDAASDEGERAEARFYEAARRLGAGDLAGARALLEEVLRSGMVSFYEVAMAQDLLGTLPPAP